jgi:hypothetical protein
VTNYKNLQYDFISITDHDYITPDPGVSGVVFIVGIEETANTNGPSHSTAYDVTDQTGTAATIQTVTNFHYLKGRLVSIAHPELPAIDVPIATLISFSSYQFLEVYNGLDYEGVDPTYGETSWDAVLSSGKHVFGIAVDDNHGNDYNKGWVVVYANNRTKADILAALLAGNFYATNGNDIGTKRTGSLICAGSSWNSTFTFIGQNGAILKTVTNVRYATYDLAGGETYVRVKSVRSSDGKEAWSQPIWIS